MSLRVAFVLPYGEHRAAFFPEGFLGWLCGEARAAGHRASMVRAFYDGADPAADREVAVRLRAWLGETEADLVVVERLFDPGPIRDHVAAAAGRRALLVTRGDSFDPVEGVELVLGATTGLASRGDSRRSPTVEELVHGFTRLLALLDAGGDPLDAPGVARALGGELRAGTPAAPPPGPLAFRPVLDPEVIALRAPPAVTQQTLFGNAGCPYAADPLENPHYRGLSLPVDRPIARRGCAFCFMGGDYQRRPDGELVAWLVEQARVYLAHDPALDTLVLSDQHALRTLAALLRAAAEAGLPRLRWLFAARADALLREGERMADAIAAAEATGHRIELYLTGFESFSDAELVRYNKGVTAAELVRAVERMRELARAHPSAFGYADARGHSLILWSPWTTPADLAESVERIRAHGLAELFDELGKNRLRLYRDLPITVAAERDGALAPEGDGGEARRKGYNVERAWRFLDRRTAAAHRLAGELRARLGTETEVAQLAAIARFCETGDDVERVLEGLGALQAALDRLLGAERAPGAPARGRFVDAEVVLLGGACNNGCLSCPNRERFADDATVRARVESARGRPVVLAGREPTLHPAFLELVALGRPTGVVTNGRRFAYPHLTAAAVRAGLAAASVKIFAPDAATADAIARDAGAHAQALDGARGLVLAGLPVELRAPLHRVALDRFAEHAALAGRLGAAQLRIDADLDAIGLDRLDEAARAVEALTQAAAAGGVSLEASPLTAGARFFRRMPS